MANDFKFLGVTASSEVLAWDMETLSGGQIKDLSGNARHGTITGATNVDTGAWGSARRFNGAGNKIVAGDVDLALPFSVLIALFPDATQSDSVGCAVDKGNPGNYSIRWNKAAQTITVSYFDGGSTRSLTSNLTAPAGQWTYVAAVFTVSGGNTRVDLYLNGILDTASAVLTGQPVTNANTTTTGEDTAAGNRFKGDLDEFYLYSRALSAAETKAVGTAPFSRLTSADGARKMPIFDQRTNMSIHREITNAAVPGNVVVSIDLKSIKRSFTIQGLIPAFGAFSAEEVLAEMESFAVAYGTDIDLPNDGKIVYEWGRKDAAGTWKTYFVWVARFDPSHDVQQMGGSSRLFHYVMQIVEGGDANGNMSVNG
jgi:hypothetical protein